MKVVLDSNVIIASLATRGLCSSLFELCLLDHRIIVSEDLLHEIAKNLSKKIKLPHTAVQENISFLRNHAEVAQGKKLPGQVSRDPDDDAVLALALAAEAACIVTGDDDLLCLKKFHTIPILSPREFWDFLKKQGPKSHHNK